MNQRSDPSERLDRRELDRAIAAHEAGDFAAAERGYQAVLRNQPDNDEALTSLGVLLFNKGLRAQGEQLLRRSLQIRSDDPQGWLQLGNVLQLKPDLPGACDAFRRATELAPDLALALLSLGGCLWRLGRLEDAIAALHRAAALDPSLEVAYRLESMLLGQLGRYPEAAAVYEKWLLHHPTNPFARHMLAATSGRDVPARASVEHIRHNFDRMAVDFDQHLRKIGYCGPEVVAASLRTRLREGARVDILDAGCGTGLCGVPLRSLARRLVGVDLSGKMTEKARARGVYDELAIEEISAFMRSRPASFDVVVCVDTLNYFGALEEPLAGARACLRPGGLLAFTTERLDDSAPHRLEQHGRYTHSEPYLRDSVANAGFTQLVMDTHVLRRERGMDCPFNVTLAVAP